MKATPPKIEPCPDCPYPTNFTVNTLTVDSVKEKYAVHCRECGDSWIEEINTHE